MIALIVDDEPYMIEYIEKLVDWEQYGFTEILTARGGSMAKKILEERRPNLLVTDIKMPNITGLDLSKLIYEQHMETKVIIISGYSDFEYAQQALRYGVLEYLVKPVLKSGFVECLNRIVDSYFKEQIEKKEEDFLSVLKRYVEENYANDISLDILGELVHLNPAYLSRVFKEKMGINISGYITDVRMKKAAEMLVKTDKKIHDIMLQVGYQKDQYFAAVFKEQYGMTPKEYRRINQK